MSLCCDDYLDWTIRKALDYGEGVAQGPVIFDSHSIRLGGGDEE